MILDLLFNISSTGGNMKLKKYKVYGKTIVISELEPVFATNEADADLLAFQANWKDGHNLSENKATMLQKDIFVMEEE